MTYIAAIRPEEAANASPPARRPAGALAIRLIDAARDAGEKGLIYLAPNERVVERQAELIRRLAQDVQLLILPPWDCFPYEGVSPSCEAMGRRMSALNALAQGPKAPWLLLSSVDAVLQRVPPRSVWNQDAQQTVRTGESLDVAELETFLRRTGYVFDDRVDEPGEAALRGQVIDIFPAGESMPVRIEHEGGRVSQIRCYDPLSQRTSETELAELTLLPASEIILPEQSGTGGRFAGAEHWLPQFYPELETIFAYAPLAALSGAERLDERRREVLEQVGEAFEARRDVPSRIGEDDERRAVLPPDRLYLDKPAWDAALDGREFISLSREDAPIPRFAEQRSSLAAAASYINERIESAGKIVLTGSSGDQVNTIALRVRRRLGREIVRVDDWNAVRAAGPGAIVSLVLPIDRGFDLPAEATTILAAGDILGQRVRTDRKAPLAALALEQTDLQLGDTVIHLDRGLAILRGLETIEAAGERSEMIRLEYAGEATLLVPTGEIGAIWRYGSNAQPVSLDKLDGDAWEKRRAKVEGEIAESAARLDELSEARARAKARSFAPKSGDYDRFVARFPFSESPDQAAAIDDTLQDLASGRQMNRLVCGDVGFGKTEVALRAAAAVAMAGGQVAVIAPTTVLARQHLETFRKRFAGFDIEIGQLSRFTKTAEAREVKQGLSDGRIRIVVGTQALGGKDVRFKDLGLLIVDEEQRFGTRQKAMLRRLGKAAHVLTLTATPIPRTLQAAIVGIQDLSVIATPPVRRRPLRTVLTPFDPVMVRQALMREHARGGQSFVVCPRIEDMEPMAAQLRELAPQLRIIVAHGKMSADEIDDAMMQFAQRRSDVLLATNIVESGLDLPNANTMLVWHPERFGMAQLHQLRGRVGRGRRRGMAYLLTDPESKLAAATEKRLRTLETLDRLGAGFEISARDLDLRGAGDLIGEEQAGHIKLIGADLYRNLLKRALRTARQPAPEKDWAPELNLGAPAVLPQDYVPQPEVRLNVYARLARLETMEDAENFLEEIEDRFGAAPQELQDLLARAQAAILCRELDVAKIEGGPQAIAITFRDGRGADAPTAPDGAEWRENRLVIPRATSTVRERCSLIFDLLRQVKRPKARARGG